jgi:hypothetical protein
MNLDHEGSALRDGLSLGSFPNRFFHIAIEITIDHISETKTKMQVITREKRFSAFARKSEGHKSFELSY